MKNRITSTGVGYTTHKGIFAALIHRLRLSDESSILTSWGAYTCAQLLASLSALINASNSPEDPAAEDLFRKKELALSQDDIEAPGLNSVVEEVWGSIEKDKLFLNLKFKKTQSVTILEILPDDARSLLGYTANTLQAAGVLDAVLADLNSLTDARLLFTCVVTDGGTSIQHYSYPEPSSSEYKALPFLYLFTLLEKHGDDSYTVLGGIFVKSCSPDGSQQMQTEARRLMSMAPELNSLQNKNLVIKSSQIVVEDGLPLSEKHYLHQFATSYTRHSTGGSA